MTQIIQQDFSISMTIVLGLGTQDSRWVQGRDDGRKTFRLLDLAVGLRDFERGTKQGLSSDRPKADDQPGMHNFQFCLKPGAASMDLLYAGLFVNAELSARLPFEMLDGIGDVNFSAIDTGFFQAFIE